MKRKTAQKSAKQGSETVGTVRDVSPDMELRQRRPSRAKLSSVDGVERISAAATTNGNEGSESSDNEEVGEVRVHWEERKKAKLVKKPIKKKKNSRPPMSTATDDRVSVCSVEPTSVGIKRNGLDAQLIAVVNGQESNDSSVDAVKVTRPSSLSVGGDNSAGDFPRDSGTKNSSSVSADEASFAGIGETVSVSAPAVQMSGAEQSVPSSPQVGIV